MATAPHNEDDGPERLGEADAFLAELARLAELAPEPWATQLRAILEQSSR